jgi:hypothetical protein
VLNGAEGMNSLVASLATQGAAILDQVRDSFRPYETPELEARTEQAPPA